VLKKWAAVAESTWLSDWTLAAVMNQAGLVAAEAAPPDSMLSAAPATIAAPAAAAVSLASGRRLSRESPEWPVGGVELVVADMKSPDGFSASDRLAINV
jgi:hypothetical protein